MQFHQDQLFYGNMLQSEQMETSRLVMDEHYRRNHVRSADHNKEEHEIQIQGSQIGHTKDHQRQANTIDGRHGQIHRINGSQRRANQSQDNRCEDYHSPSATIIYSNRIQDDQSQMIKVQTVIRGLNSHQSEVIKLN